MFCSFQFGDNCLYDLLDLIIYIFDIFEVIGFWSVYGNTVVYLFLLVSDNFDKFTYYF